MRPLHRLSIAEQTAALLREGLKAGRWREGLPGVLRIAADLGISKDSVRAALRLLEAEGTIAAQGHGRRRQLAEAGRRNPQTLRVGLLLHDRVVDENAEMQRTLLQLHHDLEAAGHVCVFTTKTQSELMHEPRRIARLVAATQAAAWIVIAATRPVLEWFAAQPFPAIAFGGRCLGLPLASAGLDFVPGLRAAVRQLVALGHRRIVLIGPNEWGRPSPGTIVRGFLDELEAQGVSPSAYNFPAWTETPAGLHTLLESLFRHTPPTALLIDEPARAAAVLAFLGQRRLRVPHEVSLVCLIQDALTAWCTPPLAHLRYDNSLPARRIVRWIDAIARGKSDRDIVMFPVEFDPGGSIGPAFRK